MHCESCGAVMAPGEEREVRGKKLCDDCALDAMATVKTCDPWAVHAAKTFAQDELVLRTRQENILRLLRATPAGLTAEELAARAGISRQELERDFATLRHMEKARAQQRADGRKVLVAWQAVQETT